MLKMHDIYIRRCGTRRRHHVTNRKNHVTCIRCILKRKRLGW